MVSLFNALNISSNALTVNESAISVVSHNVANMNTEGYSKQKVNLATRYLAGSIGDSVNAQVRHNGGVMIANVMRYNDEYLNSYYRDQLSKLKEYEQQLDGLGDLSDIFNDLEGEGVDALLSNFYEAVNNLNEYPASSTARINFIETAKTLTAALNTKSSQLDELTAKALGDGETLDSLQNSKIYLQIEDFNNKLEELAEINRALQITQTGTLDANNLLDKRDMALSAIAEYVDIHVEEKRNGSVNVYMGDIALVEGSEVKGEFNIQPAKFYCNGNPDLYPNGYPQDWVTTDADGNVVPREAAVVSIVQRSKDGTETVIEAEANNLIKGGILGGLIHSADLNGEGFNIGVAQETLNKVANAVASVFNQLNTREGAYYIDPENTNILKATDADNTIFVTDDGSTNITAGNITINAELLTDTGCWKIACAYFENPNGLDVPPNFDERAVGNSQNAVDMLNSRNLKLDGVLSLDGVNPLPDLNGMSIEDFYTGLLGKIAVGGSNAEQMVETQGNVVDSIYNQIRSNNSVDLNEELVDLVKYQTAYSAAAQVFNTCNSCLDTLMALGG